MNEHLQSERDLDPRDLWPFEQVQRETEEFERILRRFGITILPGSPLERMCMSLLELEECRQSGGDTMEDLRIAYRPAFGLNDIVRRVVRLHNHQDFPVLIDHLHLLNTGTVAQNISAVTDQEAAKIFELLIGLICLEVGTNTNLDSPVRSYGDNPDILTDLDGRRWGFACKVPSGTSPKTLFQRLKEGIAQIEKSPAAEIGCVIFNLKNYIDHDKTWPLNNPDEYLARKENPIYRCWASILSPLNILRSHAWKCQQQLVTSNGRGNVRALFGGKKSIPGALFLLQTTTQLQYVEGPVNTVLGLFHLMDEGVSSADAAVLNKLNDAMHHH